MDEIEQYQHKLHARTSGFNHKLERTWDICQEAMKQDAHFYLAFSGGIDSTCLLALLYWGGYRVPLLWGDDGFDYPESMDFLKQTEEKYNIRITRIRCMQPWRDWCNEMGRPDLANDPQALEAWGSPHTWDATWQSLKDASQHSYGGVFLGLLASESRTRSYALHDGWKPLYQVKSEGGMWHCSPLANWTKRDIWAYVVSRNLPYNPIYDTLASLGLPLERRRVAPLTCFMVLQYGSVVALKQGWPQLYNQLAAMFPRVREYS